MRAIRQQYDRLPEKTRSNIRSLMPDRLLRWYAHRRTDVYLISYPKCGRTWLRLMMGKALAMHFSIPESEEMLFLKSNRKFHPDAPTISVVHEDSPMLKSPDELEISKERFHDKKVIFLVRDPRDVAVSSYFETKKRNKLFGENPYERRTASFSGNLVDFIHSKIGSFDTILAYYQIWYKNRHIPREFLLIRYEDMKIDPSATLRKVLDFLGIGEISDRVIGEAVSYASFDNMRKMEMENQFQSGILNPGDPTDHESFKTRTGKISGYHDYLSKEIIEELNLKIRRNLPDVYGYNTD